MATVSTTNKKTRGVKPSEDLEPLAPIFMDEEEGAEEEDDDDEPAPKAKPARNIGSLLSPGKADDDDAPESDDDVQVNEAPEPKKPHAAALYWQEAKRVGPAHAKAALVKKLSDRVKQHQEDIRKWGSDGEHGGVILSTVSSLGEALRYLEEAAKGLESFPVGWAPPEKSPAASSKTLTEGTRVSVKKSARGEYDGALEPDEMVGLSVVRHEPGKSKVACKTADGSRVVIPRAHLELCIEE